MNKIIETERLILKPTDVEDAAFVLALLNSPKWKEYIGDRNIKIENIFYTISTLTDYD